MAEDKLSVGVRQPITANDDDVAETMSYMPDLPSPGQRWTTRRKAAVVAAVRGGWVPVEEVSQLYALSADEIVAWERDLDKYGVPGLRSTRLQIYRDTDRARETIAPDKALPRRGIAGARWR